MPLPQTIKAASSKKGLAILDPHRRVFGPAGNRDSYGCFKVEGRSRRYTFASLLEYTKHPFRQHYRAL